MEKTEIIRKAVNEIRRECCGGCETGKAIAALERLLLDKKPDTGSMPARMTSGNRRKSGIKTGGGRKTCSGCGNTKPLEDFPKNKTCRGGHASTCKTCIYERAKKRAAKKKLTAADKDRFQEYDCSLCNEEFIAPERLASHMRVVYGAVAT